MIRRVWLPIGLLWLVAAWPLSGQAPQPAKPPSEAPAAADGIPITSSAVQKACGACHKPDEKQRMSRISSRRTTPEGWQETSRRMVALNGAKVDPQQAREIVKYLSDNLGLAPEEARPGAYEVERRVVDTKYPANSDTEALCMQCHSIGRVILQRRTREEWDLLIAMHRGWYPLVDTQGTAQAFRRRGPLPRDRGPDGRPADTRHPVEKAVDHLARAFPLTTPEWTSWSAGVRSPRLEGAWALSGWDPGKGPVFGRVTLTPVPNATDEFTSAITYTYPRTGQTVSRTGRVLVYTGFQWRGRSTQGTDEATALREVMFVERDWQRIEGRWFTGGYDELGLDVRLDRASGGARISGTDRLALRIGVTGQELRIYGANLPASPTARDVDLGPGVTVTRVVSATPELLTVTVDVAAAAKVGTRDLFVGGAARPQAVTVYDKVDAIRVSPSWNMSRVGGVTFPKMLSQFEAWGYHNGPDGKPGSADDLKLDVVPATWGLEEYTATFDDDDLAFVGGINAETGLFTPNIEGPNPKRSGERNNIGDVWAVATYYDRDAGSSSRPLRARAHLLVTVPLYMRWEPLGGGR
jgi:quinohemoprotein amine dehydrogenase